MLERLYDLLGDLSDRPFIRAYENGREPEKPFFTYELKFERTPEHFHYSAVNDEGNQTVKTHIDAVLELNYFGGNSLQALRDVCMRLSMQSCRERWLNDGVALIRIGRITHLAFLNEQREYEDRAMVELEIRYAASVQDIVSIIEQVEVTANIGRASEKNLIGVNENGEN